MIYFLVGNIYDLVTEFQGKIHRWHTPRWWVGTHGFDMLYL